MNKEEKIELLIKKYHFNEGTALAYVESNGKCVYCGTELMDNLLGYFSADIDHLLPKSKYPDEEKNIHNWVLSCHACNLMKGKIDIDNLPWSVEQALFVHKKELIDIICQKLKAKRDYRERELSGVRSIVKSI